MILTHKITLSLDQRGDRQSIDAVQGDTARAVEVSLLEDGAAWAVPEDTTAVIRYRRVQGGTGGLYDTLPDGSPGYAISENAVTVYLAPQVLAVPGPVELQVTLQKDGAELTCFTILIHVQGNLSDAETDSECYVNLTEHIQATVEEMNLAKKEQGIIYIVGDDSSTSGVWTGTSPEITEYFDGLIVAYRTAATGGGASTTLDINGLGAAAVKRNGLSYDVNYSYAKGTVLLLTYVVVDGVGYWQMTDIWWTDSDRKTSATPSTEVKLILIGAKVLSAAGMTTYANPSCFVGADNCLYSGGRKVATADELPEEVPDFVRTEAERLAKLVQSRQNGNTFSFMLGSDIHARLGLEGDISSDQMLSTTLHAAQAMEIVAKQVHLDFAGLLGDLIWDEGETAEQAMELYRLIFEYFRPAFVGLPQFWCKGNHDMLPSAETELTDAEVFSGIGIHNSGAEFDSAARVQGYCCRDFSDRKIRVVCMNTSETSGSYAVGTAQNNWLKTVLDVETGWKVIILSHIPLDWWGTDATVYQTVAGFADNILCNIHGHTHNYVCGRVGDTAIARVAIPNIDFYRPNTYADNATFGEADTYSKTADSAEDTAFCVITVDLDANTLYADHYGAGCDRVVDLSADSIESDEAESDEETGEETGGYTNQISLSTSAFGGTEVYNTVGYKSGCRINSSFEEVEVTGMCCTGFMAVQPGDVLRVKKVTLSGSSTAYVVTYSTTGGEYATLDVSVLGEADSDGVYSYTVPEQVGAIRLSLGVIDDTSIVTVNEEIG